MTKDGHFHSNFDLRHLHNWAAFLFPVSLSVGKMSWIWGPGRHHGPPAAVATHPMGLVFSPLGLRYCKRNGGHLRKKNEGKEEVVVEKAEEGGGGETRAAATTAEAAGAESLLE